MNEPWDVLTRQSLARDNRLLLTEAMTAATDLNIQAILRAFEQRKFEEAYRCAEALFPDLMAAGRRAEALTVRLLPVDLQARLTLYYMRFPLERQAQALQMGLDACLDAIGLAEALDDAECLGFYKAAQADGLFYARQIEAARQAYEEASDIRRGLAQTQPAVYLPYLAKTLNNLGNALRDLREWEAARKAYEEAFNIHRRLAQSQPAIHLPDSAGTLNNLGVVLRDLNESNAAREAFEEALAIYRRLAETQPTDNLPNLAITLNNLGNMLRDQREWDAARKVYVEALETYRHLAEAQPVVYLPDVANALNNLAVVLHDLRELKAARKVHEEALAAYRMLAQTQPTVYLSNVAGTLNNLAVVLRDLRESKTARKLHEEALAIGRRLAESQSTNHLSNLAMTLSNLGVVQGDLHELKAAREAFEEALAIYRRLAETQPADCLTNLAMTLNNLGVVLRDLQEWEAARKSFEEAISLQEDNGLWLESADTHCNLGGLVQRENPSATEHIRLHFRASVKRCEQGLRQLQERKHSDKFKSKVEYAYNWLIEDGARHAQYNGRVAHEELLGLLEAMRQVEMLAELGVALDVEAEDETTQTLAVALDEEVPPLLAAHDAALLWVQATPNAVVFVMFTPEMGFRIALAERALMFRMRAMDEAMRRAIQIHVATRGAPTHQVESLNVLTAPVAEEARKIYDVLPEAVKTLLMERRERALFVLPCSVSVNMPWELIQTPVEAGGWEYLGLQRHLPRLHSARHVAEILQRQPRRNNVPPAPSRLGLRRRAEILQHRSGPGNAPPTAIIVGDPTQDLLHSFFAAEELQVFLKRECGFQLMPNGYALTREQATVKALKGALDRDFLLWVQLSHGGWDDTHLYLAMAEGGKVYPQSIASRRWQQHPIVHHACCYTGLTAGEGGGRFSGHPTAALIAGASCVLSSTMPLFDKEDAEFCAKLYAKALDRTSPRTFGAALLETRREMAAEYGGNPLVWGQYALWGNPWARLVA